MTTTCDPGVGLFRAMEDAGELADRLAERGENIFNDLIVEGWWRSYPAMTATLTDRVLEEIGDDAPRLLAAIYWLSSCHNPKKKEQAEIWLSALSERLDGIFNEEIDEELDRQDQDFIKYGEY